MNKTSIVILAAGNSSRLGTVKQLLEFNNKTLLRHTIDEALLAGAGPVIVVTGCADEYISKSIQGQLVHIVFNEAWEEGMGSGIVTGVRAAMAGDTVESIIIAVCDQPFISAELFKALCHTHVREQKSIVASAYSDTVGTPALFGKKYFDELLSLKGEEGAKKIIKANAQDVVTVDFPNGGIDIDTKTDYEKLLANKYQE